VRSLRAKKKEIFLTALSDPSQHPKCRAILNIADNLKYD